MKTILSILQRAGGFRPTLYIKIANPPYMELVIEAVDEPGPMGMPVLSVAHYGQQNGDLMRDPEMCFEVVRPLWKELHLDPFFWRNDYVGVEEWSRSLVDGHYIMLPDLHRKHQDFAVLWENTLEKQGYLDAFKRRSILG